MFYPIFLVHFFGFMTQAQIIFLRFIKKNIILFYLFSFFLFNFLTIFIHFSLLSFEFQFKNLIFDFSNFLIMIKILVKAILFF